MITSPTGKIYIGQAKKNLSESMKRMWLNKPKSQSRFNIKTINALKAANSIPVNQYDKNGVFIKEWNSMKDAERELNIRSISTSIKRNGKAGGFIWKKKQ